MNENHLQLLSDASVRVPFLLNEDLMENLMKVVDVLNLDDKRPVLLDLKNSKGSVIMHPAVCKLVSSDDFIVFGILHNSGKPISQYLSQVQEVHRLEIEYQESNPADVEAFLSDSQNVSDAWQPSNVTSQSGRLNMSRVNVVAWWRALNNYFGSNAEAKQRFLVGERKNYYAQLVRPKVKRNLVSVDESDENSPRIKVFIELSFNLDSHDTGTAYIKLIIEGGDEKIRLEIQDQFRKQKNQSTIELPDLDWKYSSGKHRITVLLAKEVFSNAMRIVTNESGMRAETTSDSEKCFSWYSEQLDIFTKDVFATLIT